jgi:hypothetical protein
LEFPFVGEFVEDNSYTGFWFAKAATLVAAELTAKWG